MFGDSGAYLIGFLSALDLVQITNEIELLSKYFCNYFTSLSFV